MSAIVGTEDVRSGNNPIGFTIFRDIILILLDAIISTGRECPHDTATSLFATMLLHQKKNQNLGSTRMGVQFDIF